MDEWKRREKGKAANYDNSNEFREEGQCTSNAPSYYLDKFSLYKNSSHFYMIGRDITEKHWRVLTIDRVEPCELKLNEDPKAYTSEECMKLVQDLKCVASDCYGILGFIKLVHTYYLLLITHRKEIGKICGHAIYSISDYKTIPICRSNSWKYVYNSTRETRYRKLLQLVDVRDNFFFSWSYPLMHRLQRNLNNPNIEDSSDRNMFVWNEYLTQQTRVTLKNSLWTVSLIHGFFMQTELCVARKKFIFTLIARRSCQFAGTRYEKRGVDNQGQAANDVEIEQIVYQPVHYAHNDCPSEISSSVQIRGSIPLSWSQKPVSFTVKPPKILYTNGNYEPTKLHFESLRRRYEVPHIILSLLKTSHNKPNEYKMHRIFQNAIGFINQDLAKDDQVEPLSLDLDAAFKDTKIDELMELKGLVAPALKKIGIFSCKMPQSLRFKALSNLSYIRLDKDSANYSSVTSSSRHSNNNNSKFQKGILRTNCLDSLDRTNVAQYVYGVVALGHQLNTLKLIEYQELKFRDSLAYDLMNIYQAMGDALSQQYAGSSAHHKIFAKFKGQNKMATRIQEFIKSVQRHYNNSFRDGTKQQAIDLFLGNLQPDVALISPSTSSSQGEYCDWLQFIYLRNMASCFHSGFERLGGSDRSRMIRPPGSSHYGSQEGISMRDLAAGP